MPTGRHMRAALEESGPFELIVLDLMLPGEDGLALYQLVRQKAGTKDRLFEIEFLDPGAQAYAFTFGQQPPS